MTGTNACGLATATLEIERCASRLYETRSPARKGEIVHFILAVGALRKRDDRDDLDL